jgi:nitrite reductase/ring-hydroxylating ferredoxin subunit
MKNIVTCPFHAAQFDTTNGKKLREPSSSGPRIKNLLRRVEETLAGSLQNLVVYQPMNKKNAMWKLMAIK